MIKHTMLGAAVALALSIAATTASAADAGWYFGGSLGEASIDFDQDDGDAGAVAFAEEFGFITSADSSLEDSDTSFSVFGGYRFNPYIGVELGYLSLGTAEYQAEGTIDPYGGPVTTVPVTFGLDIESKGFTLAGVGSVPLGDMFDLHARLGLFFSDTEITGTGSVGNIRESVDFSGTDQDVFYGIGAALNLGENWSISLDWTQYKDVGNEDDTGEDDVDNLSLSVIFRI